MEDLVSKAQNYLNEHIPITKFLGVTVETFDGNSIELTAPLSNNINHRGTAFGGSLVSLAMLSGWVILHLKLLEENLDCRLVIQKSTMDFLAPGVTDFKATCTLPPEDKWQKFLKTIRKKGKARLRMQAEIYCNDQLVSKHDGQFVAAAINQSDK